MLSRVVALEKAPKNRDFSPRRANMMWLQLYDDKKSLDDKNKKGRGS